MIYRSLRHLDPLLFIKLFYLNFSLVFALVYCIFIGLPVSLSVAASFLTKMRSLLALFIRDDFFYLLDRVCYDIWNSHK